MKTKQTTAKFVDRFLPTSDFSVITTAHNTFTRSWLRVCQRPRPSSVLNATSKVKLSLLWSDTLGPSTSRSRVCFKRRASRAMVVAAVKPRAGRQVRARICLLRPVHFQNTNYRHIYHYRSYLLSHSHNRLSCLLPNNSSHNSPLSITNSSLCLLPRHTRFLPML